jgi:hypothetical protein
VAAARIQITFARSARPICAIGGGLEVHACLECGHPSQGFVLLALRRAAWWAFHLNNELCQVLLLSRKLDKQLVLLRLFPLSGCRGANRLDVGVAIAVVGTCMWRWAKGWGLM